MAYLVVNFIGGMVLQVVLFLGVLLSVNCFSYCPAFKKLSCPEICMCGKNHLNVLHLSGKMSILVP